VSDPGLRTDEWDAWMASSAAAEAAMPFSAARVLEFNLEPMLHSGDMRWTYNTTEMRKGWKPEDAVAFIRPIIASSPVDLIIVGGIDVETAIRETAKTFGALPQRADRREPDGIRDVRFAAHPGEPIVLRHKGRADQAYAIIAWPTGAGFYRDPKAARAGLVLADMLRDEATRQLRTGSGATYSPITLSEFSFELPDYGYIGVEVEVPPAKLDAVLAQIEGIAADLAAYPMAASEVTRITGPRIEQAKRDQAASAGYWMEHLAKAMRDREKLDVVRSEIADYQSLTPADIQAAAKRWLKPDTVWKLKVMPE
jgi:zinc protease